METIEFFKDITGFENMYQISNKGRIKSVQRTVRSGKCGKRTIPEKLRRLSLNDSGYQICTLSKDGNTGGHYVHHLVWEAFGDRKPNYPSEHIDHIDNNKLNNAIDNLQILSARDNVAKRMRQNPKSSKYTGVSFVKGKWYAHIRINGKKKHLGAFDTEEEAALAYLKAKSSIYSLAA